MNKKLPDIVRGNKQGGFDIISKNSEGEIKYQKIYFDPPEKLSKRIKDLIEDFRRPRGVVKKNLKEGTNAKSKNWKRS